MHSELAVSWAATENSPGHVIQNHMWPGHCDKPTADRSQKRTRKRLPAKDMLYRAQKIIIFSGTIRDWNDLPAESPRPFCCHLHLEGVQPTQSDRKCDSETGFPSHPTHTYPLRLYQHAYILFTGVRKRRIVGKIYGMKYI